MVASGKKMDTSLRELGIDGNTLVVITASSHTANTIHRVFWTFKYWGFSNKYVNMENKAHEQRMAIYELEIQTRYYEEKMKEERYTNKKNDIKKCGRTNNRYARIFMSNVHHATVGHRVHRVVSSPVVESII